MTTCWPNNSSLRWCESRRGNKPGPHSCWSQLISPRLPPCSSLYVLYLTPPFSHRLRLCPWLYNKCRHRRNDLFQYPQFDTMPLDIRSSPMSTPVNTPNSSVPSLRARISLSWIAVGNLNAQLIGSVFTCQLTRSRLSHGVLLPRPWCGKHESFQVAFSLPFSFKASPDLFSSITHF